MDKRIVVVKKAVEKKEAAAGICCYGALVPLVRM
jgi:hypothetical protein